MTNITLTQKSNAQCQGDTLTFVGVPVVEGIVAKFPVSRHVLSLPSYAVHSAAGKPSRRKLGAQRLTLRNRAASLVLLAGLFAMSVAIPNGNISSTLSYFRDAETSIGNLFRAGLLDFLVADATYERTITATSIPLIVPVMTPSAGSFPTMYRVTAEQTGGVTALCNALNAEATTSPFIYSGALLALNTTPTTTTGVWNLGLTLATTTGLVNGDICNADLIYRGWHPDAAENTGFTDEERVHLIITYEATADVQDIVINEFLPNPDEGANGLFLGDDNDSIPFGEWVELYNKGPAPVDVLDWYMADASGGGGNTHAVIGPANTNTGATIIPSGGWLVVYMNHTTLNNTGDEIHLFTDNDVEVDSYVYDNPSDFCENDPTPGVTNATTTPPSGTPGQGQGTDCSDNQVSENKSYARIPDGTGAFVDPIPTPGAPNIPDPEPPAASAQGSGEPLPEVLGAEDSATTTEPTAETPTPNTSASASAPAPSSAPAPEAEESAAELDNTLAEESTAPEEPATEEEESPPADQAAEPTQETAPAEETPAAPESAKSPEEQPAIEPEAAPAIEPPPPIEAPPPPPEPESTPSPPPEPPAPSTDSTFSTDSGQADTSTESTPASE